MLCLEFSPDNKSALVDINTLCSNCGFFYDAQPDPWEPSAPNNGYNCKHRDNEAIESGIRCCYASSCPLGWEADQKDCESYGVEYSDGSLVVVDDPTTLNTLSKTKMMLESIIK